MRKLFSGLLAAALVLSLATTGAFACHHGGCGGVNYVDADGDGVCDNYAAVGQGRGCGRGWGRGRGCGRHCR